MKWRPVDYMVAALVAAMCYAIFMIGAATYFDAVSDNDARAKLAAGLLSSVIAIISMYIGGMIRKDDE